MVVELPEHVQLHLLQKMREHLETLDSIIDAMADGDLDLASDIASSELAGHGSKHNQGVADQNQNGYAGKSHQHGQVHNEESRHGEAKRIQMGRYMPEAMKMMGQNMHNAANEFSIIAAEGDTQLSLKALKQLTTSCVTCHRAYRIERFD